MIIVNYVTWFVFRPEVLNFCLTLADWGGGVQGVRPPSAPEKSCKGVHSKVQNYFLREIFFPGGMPPDPPSYGTSDVNPHLT